MSFWNAKEDYKEETREPIIVPEGDYTGRIQDVEIKQTAAGHRMFQMGLKLEGLKFPFRHILNVEHPNTAQFAKQTIGKILNFGYMNPPVELATVDDAAAALKGAPITVRIQHGEKTEHNGKSYQQYKVFFNKVADGLKADFANRAGSSSTVTESAY